MKEQKCENLILFFQKLTDNGSQTQGLPRKITITLLNIFNLKKTKREITKIRNSIWIVKTEFTKETQLLLQGQTKMMLGMKTQ